MVLFLHGVGGGHESWAPQLDSFSRRFCAAAWDMPGYGDSAPLERMTFPSLAESLLCLLDDRGWERVHLVGHSMGGMVAQEFAVAHQDRLSTLTLSATSPAFGSPDGEFQRRFVADRLAPLDEGRGMEAVARNLAEGFMGANARPDALAAAIAAMARVPEATYRAAVACIVTFGRRANLPDVRVPTLVLAGSEDRNASAPMMERMASKIPGSRDVCLDGVGHLANMERPDAFDRTVMDFIRAAGGG